MGPASRAGRPLHETVTQSGPLSPDLPRARVSCPEPERGRERWRLEAEWILLLPTTWVTRGRLTSENFVIYRIGHYED